MTRRTLADVLAEARKRSGLSLAEVAEKMKDAEEAGHGRAVSKAAIGHAETGHSMPGADVLEALAWVYDVEVGQLYPSGAGAA